MRIFRVIETKNGHITTFSFYSLKDRNECIKVDPEHRKKLSFSEHLKIVHKFHDNGTNGKSGKIGIRIDKSERKHWGGY